MNGVLIRAEKSSDSNAIRNLITEVFGQTYGSGEAEAALVAQLRQKPEYGPIISLVAEIEGVVIGHVFFSSVRLVNHPDIAACALAPLGVYRQHQNQGIGSQLVQKGLTECAHQGYRAAFVQGSLKYYPRFGFMPIGGTHLHTVFKSDHDMAMEFESGLLDKLSGLVDYPAPWQVFK